MAPMATDDAFLKGLPTFSTFADIANPDRYTPLPEDWLVGIADVVGSTEAIAEGRYKAVNMAGVAVISAVSNAVGHGAFPFVFGGDGASFAVPAAWSGPTRDALAATATFVGEEYGLELRVAAIPVAAIRAAGVDIQVARFAASPHVAYAVFSGGGLAWADAQVRAGIYAVPPAPPGTRPDLSGLSCGFEPMAASNGIVASLIVRPVRGNDTPEYRALIGEILELIERRETEIASPVPPQGPRFSFPTAGFDLGARTSRRAGEALGAARLRFGIKALFSWLVLRTGWKFRGFEPSHYLRQLAANSDYRKYDDGLRMTVDCSPALADEIENRLRAASDEGIVRYGLHRQKAALMTCYTPSIHQDDHIHFVDGAAGGYAAAASQLKASGAA